MPEITIDPITRLEGHLGVKVLVEDGTVRDARCMATLFRGIESILIDRDPRDAPIITSRICGVCHEVHRLTSLLALEDAAKITADIPEDAARIRNIIEAVTSIYSHAASLLVLSGPDFGVYGLASKVSPTEATLKQCEAMEDLTLDLNKYYKLLHEVVLPAQRWCHEILALFGGKVPHHMTTVPGGVAEAPDASRLVEAYVRILKVKDVVYTVYKYVMETLVPHLLDRHPDLVTTLASIGVGHKNFISYGVYVDPSKPEDPTKRLLKPGVVYADGTKATIDVKKIVEDVKSSWYTDDSGGKVIEEIPPKDSYGKAGAYSWAKAPRYNGKPCEAGPLARLIASGITNPITKKPFSPGDASLLFRLIARLEELKIVTDYAVEEIPKVTPGAKVYVPYEVPESAEGVGLWEAPRGAIIHFVRIDGRKIARYQIITPTGWNVSPRGAAGIRGPIEESLLGIPVPNGDVINILRVVRSYDPCLACTVHVITPDGKTITEELDHKYLLRKSR